MATTPHHKFPVPDATAPMKPRLDIGALATDIDAKVPKITYGTGAPPTTGVIRDGDIYLQYIATAAPAPPAPAPAPAPKKPTRKAASG